MRMQRIVWAFTACTTAAWLFGLWVDPPALNGRGVTHEVFYWNGVLAWGFMAMAIVIAARPAWLEGKAADHDLAAWVGKLPDLRLAWAPWRASLFARKELVRGMLERYEEETKGV